MPTAKKLPSGNWRCQVYLGRTEAGKKIVKSVTAPTKKEAERLAALAEFEHDRDQARPHSLLEAANAYVESRRGVLSPSTVRGYLHIVRVALAPLHDVPVPAMTSDRVQRFISDYALTHSPKTVSNVHGFISAVLAEAAPELRLRVRLPLRRKHEIAIPTREQVERLIDSADPVLRTAIILAAMLGLRRGEVCALTWADVQRDRVQVRHALAADDNQHWIDKPPKSAAGARSLPIPPAARVHLDAARKDGRPRPVPMTPNALSVRFERLAAREHIQVTFHSLRHYYASVMLSLGVPDKYAMARMGHSTPHMLKSVYQHLMADKDRELDDAINNYFTDPKTKKAVK
jgi:integrase